MFDNRMHIREHFETLLRLGASLEAIKTRTLLHLISPAQFIKGNYFVQ